jgi:hypothetical protein
MRHIILHGHIFKNAGTTFDWSLQNKFGNGFLDHREDKLMRQQGREHLAQLVADNPQLTAISSHHMTRDLPEIPAVHFLPVYLLRHPLERVRSVYDFECQQRGSTPGAKAAKEKNFRDYVQWRMQPDVPRTIRDYQTLYLAGHHGPCSSADVVSKYFARATAHIESGALVGLVERYDESMVVLEEALREYFPAIDLSYVAQNVSKAKSGATADDAGPTEQILAQLGSVARRVIDENSFDLALYRTAQAHLQRRIDGTPGFENKLADFHSRCGKHSRGFFRR